MCVSVPKYLTGYTTPIRQRVLEVADVTLKNSGDTIDAVVDEQVAGRKQEAHVPVRFLPQNKYLLLRKLSSLFVICKDHLSCLSGLSSPMNV